MLESVNTQWTRESVPKIAAYGEQLVDIVGGEQIEGKEGRGGQNTVEYDDGRVSLGRVVQFQHFQKESPRAVGVVKGVAHATQQVTKFYARIVDHRQTSQ